MTNVIVTLNDVSKRFAKADTNALSALSATMQTGQFTGVVGPDGAGKTTLLRLLAGLLLPDTGNITIDGKDRFKYTNELTCIISYMPQRFGLYEDLSLQENLNLYAKLQGLDAKQQASQSDKLLALTNLSQFKKRLAGKLSGGMKQKLGIACALLKTPKVLLLDEPSVGVDPISRREIWTLVSEFRAEGMSVIWSTSYLDEAEKCDHVLLLNNGEVIYTGEPHALSEEVKNRTFMLVDIPDKRDFLSELQTNTNMMDGTIQGDKIKIMLKPDITLETFKQSIPDKQITIESVPANFEDGFINRLGGTSGLSKLSETVPQVPELIQDETISVRPEERHPSRRNFVAPQGERRVSKGNVICCNNLTKKFGDFTATDNITLNIQQGEVFGFLGPNGAGKSTTFKMLCGLLKPTSGDIEVLGLNLMESPSEARQRIGYMAQKFSLYDTLSVLQNLQFFSGVYGLRNKIRQDAIDEAIDIFKLHSLLSAKTSSLSLGYKQRLALACAIMHRPAILFLDEPTSGVDPITRREFWGHISALTMKGVTVMVTTHFMEEAEYCDRIALIYRGKMIAQDTPDKLKAMCSTPEKTATLEETFIDLINRYEKSEVPA